MKLSIPSEIRLKIWPRALVFILVFGACQNYFNGQLGYPSKLWFQGDSWEYQTIAVNLIYGHGYRPGIVEPFETYVSSVTPNTTKIQWHEYPEQFYRTPGYPLFLAAVYVVFGIRAEAAMAAQAVLLSLCFATLPILAWHYFGVIGLLAGLLSILKIFYSQYYFIFNVNDTYTEVLQCAGLMLLALSWLGRETGKIGMALFGFFCGLNLLIKGAFIFFPVIVLIHDLVRRKSLKSMALWFIVMLLTLAPWSIYASWKTGHLVVISTQGSGAVLEGNNEKSLRSGYWAPDGKYYERADLRDKSTLTKLVNFYLDQTPEDIWIMWRQKISNILYDVFMPSMVVFVLILCCIVSTRKKMKCGILWCASIFICISFFMDTRFPHGHFWSGLLMFGFLILFDAKNWVRLEEVFPPLERLAFPLLLTVNIFMITFIIFGLRRYFAPYHIFIMPLSYILPLACVKALYLSRRFWHASKKI